MLNHILNLQGVSKLNKSEQQSIKAGEDQDDYHDPLAAFHKCRKNCSGHCSLGGTCYQILH